MSQISIRRYLRLIVGCCTFAVSAGCGDFKESAGISGDSGKHPDTWVLVGHKSAAKSDLTSCTSCHGEDLFGGIAGISCQQCHLGGTQAVHPLEWGNFTYARHSGYVRANGSTGCANGACHGADLLGVSGSGPSCTSCHLGGVNSYHPLEWGGSASNHESYVGTYGTASCKTSACHGAQAEGVPESGVSCSSCHTFN